MADYCLCGTVADMRWIGGRYPRQRGKLRYVPNGVDVPENTSSTGGKEHDAELTVGTLTWRKNHAYTIVVFNAVLAHLPDAHLYCVGSGRVPDTGNQDTVSFIPSVPMEEMSRWYRRCPYFIHTSRYEGGHPLALLEAMAHGAVCFVSPEPAHREVITHGANGIILDGCDRKKDAATILAVMSDPQRQRELSAHAQRTAVRHRWERQAARLMRVLG